VKLAKNSIRQEVFLNLILSKKDRFMFKNRRDKTLQAESESTEEEYEVQPEDEQIDART
jgi:hypothetical protein